MYTFILILFCRADFLYNYIYDYHKRKRFFVSEMLVLFALIAFSCIFVNTFSGKLGTPALLLFMCLGMFFGSDGIFKIPFENYDVLQQISTIALIFIIFYGGFCTKWSTAKPVLKQATLLSTLGVVITALLTCAFCYYGLNMNFAESFLIGAVISSTDAASVFSILRSRNLNLKYSTASLLELESGSNDPFSYMLTIIGIAIYMGKSFDYFPILFAKQIIFGILAGVVIAVISIKIMKKTKLVNDSSRSIFLVAVALFAFALPDLFDGNGLLSVYIAGIILGNSKIRHTNILVNFFDGITFMAQILIFFLLGLTAFPHRMPEIFIPATLVAVFLTFVARPVAVFGLLMPFKASFNQCVLVSWAGLRGAASVVFAVLVVASVNLPEKYDLFHIVFLISLLSVAFQGTLLPLAAKMTNMTDDSADVRKTFTDYQEESAFSLIQIFIGNNHIWKDKLISEISLPQDTLAILIKRDGKDIVPKGDTKILECDFLVLSAPVYNKCANGSLEEFSITDDHAWNGKQICELNLEKNSLIVMISRHGNTIIPRGNTVLQTKDKVVLMTN